MKATVSIGDKIVDPQFSIFTCQSSQIRSSGSQLSVTLILDVELDKVFRLVTVKVLEVSISFILTSIWDLLTPNVRREAFYVTNSLILPGHEPF